jgi:hypothetical protein
MRLILRLCLQRREKDAHSGKFGMPEVYNMVEQPLHVDKGEVKLIDPTSSYVLFCVNLFIY